MTDKLYKTVFTVEVLSDGTVSQLDLGDLHRAINDGGCSGKVDVTSETVLTRREMALALQSQDSDPVFLLGDDGWKYALQPGDEVTIDTRAGLNGSGYCGTVNIHSIDYREAEDGDTIIFLWDRYGNLFNLEISEIS